MATPLDNISRPIANIEAPAAAIATGETKQDITPKLAQLVTGQLLKGEILSKLTDGSFTVRVAGITAKMLLPEGTKTGDQIPLRLISTEPRPTFLLEHDTDPNFPTLLPQNYAAAPDKRTSANPLPPPQIAPEDADNKPAANNRSAIPSGINEEREAGATRGSKSDTAAVVSLSSTAYSPPPKDKVDNNPLSKTGTQQIATSKSIEVSTKNNINNTQSTAATPDHLSSAPTSLSNTGRFITQILQNTPATSTKQNIASPDPIVASPAQLKDTSAIASRLQHQISNSGLFYESHVAEWAQGKRSMDDIRAEPQSKLDQSTMVNTSHVNSANPTSVNNEVGQIIQQQLNVLDQNIVRWQGELFPGQKIDWEIKKETEGHGAREQTEEINWQSTVRFDLPNLGPVTAIINFQSNNLGVSLRAEQSETVSALKDHASDLASAMQIAGSPLMSFAVNKNERS